MTKTQRDLHLDLAVDDICRLVRWAQAQWGKSETIAKRIVVGMAFNEDSIVQWAKLAAYVLTELGYTEKERPLTVIERQLRTIAERLYDVCVASARQNRQPSLPRHEERRQLEEAYNRAVFQLTRTTGESS